MSSRPAIHAAAPTGRQRRSNEAAAPGPLLVATHDTLILEWVNCEKSNFDGGSACCASDGESAAAPKMNTRNRDQHARLVGSVSVRHKYVQCTRSRLPLRPARTPLALVRVLPASLELTSSLRRPPPSILHGLGKVPAPPPAAAIATTTAADTLLSCL